MSFKTASYTCHLPLTTILWCNQGGFDVRVFADGFVFFHQDSSDENLLGNAGNLRRDGDVAGRIGQLVAEMPDVFAFILIFKTRRRKALFLKREPQHKIRARFFAENERRAGRTRSRRADNA